MFNKNKQSRLNRLLDSPKLRSDTSVLCRRNKKAIANIAEKNIIINADKFIYNKNLSTLEAIGNIKIIDSSNDILLTSDKILYYINQQRIESESKSKIKDKLGNLFLSESFIYTLNDNLIKFDNLISSLI